MSYVGVPIRFGYLNYIDLGNTITQWANDESASLPWSNVRSPLITKIGATASTVSTVTVSFMLESAQAIGYVAVNNHNLLSGSTVTLQGSANSFSATPVSIGLTISTDPALLLYTWEPGDEKTYQYWRLQITPSSAQTVSIGHVAIGSYSEVDFPYGQTVVREVDPAIVGKAVGGAKTAFILPRYREVAFSVSSMDQADRRILETVYRTVGRRKPAYILLDPFNRKDDDGFHRLTIFCHLTESMELAHINGTWTQGPKFMAEEVRQ